MSRYLLDTNIISNITKPAPSPPLVAWMAEQADESLFISALTVAELRRGLLEMPPGRRRTRLEAWFEGPDGPSALFAVASSPLTRGPGSSGRSSWADGKARGRSRNALDTIIAATARANDCIVVTDNEKDFIDLGFINPVRGAIR